jgi:hypothetical protein
MTGRPKFIVQLATAAMLGATLALGGCADSMDVNGKIFDWMGVSSAAMEQKKREPQLAARTPLVLPPNAERLPEPGSGQTSSSELAALNDPEEVKARKAKEREAEHLAYCRGDKQWKDKAFKGDDAGPNRSPYGPCPSMFDMNANINKP